MTRVRLGLPVTKNGRVDQSRVPLARDLTHLTSCKRCRHVITRKQTAVWSRSPLGLCHEACCPKEDP